MPVPASGQIPVEVNLDPPIGVRIELLACGPDHLRRFEHLAQPRLGALGPERGACWGAAESGVVGTRRGCRVLERVSLVLDVGQDVFAGERGRPVGVEGEAMAREQAAAGALAGAVGGLAPVLFERRLRARGSHLRPAYSPRCV